MNLAKYFFRGLLILLPVVITGYVIWAVFTTLDELIFSPIGDALPWFQKPPSWLSWLSSLLGIAVAVTVITIVGLLASNLLGRKIVALLERAVDRLPLIKLLYGSVKDVLGAFVGDKKSFDRPVLVSLTSDGVAKVVGFVTRDDLAFLGVAGHVAVYLPQSYNFAGNLLLVPKAQVQPLPSSSSEVMTFLVSGGVSGREEVAR